MLPVTDRTYTPFGRAIMSAIRRMWSALIGVLIAKLGRASRSDLGGSVLVEDGWNALTWNNMKPRVPKKS